MTGSRRRRRTIGQALNALVGDVATIERESSKPWASIIFSGERHRVQMRFDGIEAAIEGESLIDAVRGSDVLQMAGCLVADIEVTSTERVALAGAPDKLALTVVLSVLTLDMPERQGIPA